MISSLLFALVLAKLIWTFVCLELNAHKALALQVPVVRIPFSADSNLWVIIQPLVWRILDGVVGIPWRLYPDFVRFSHRNWQFLEKSRPVERFGPVWAVVSPTSISLHVADPDAIVEVYSRWKDFVRPSRKYGMLAFYGPSIFSVQLDDWPRHRKAVAAPFNEDLMRLVWRQSLLCTEGTLQKWTTATRQAEMLSLEEDLRALTFNVLAATAFQESQESQKSETPSPCPQWRHEETTATYRDTLHVVLENAILLMIIPYRHLCGRLVPKHLAKIGLAAKSFKDILMEMVKSEAAAINSNSDAAGGLLTPLVRAFESQKAVTDRLNSKDDETVSRARRGALSADEILGNVFAINFAGHDTVLIALTFALTLLAANPDAQEWLSEGITACFGENDESSEWSYDNASKLVRCHAVFLETLRLFAPITGVPKLATGRITNLKVSGRIVPIAPDIEVFPVLLGVQTDERWWGESPNEWCPSRWIVQAGTVGDEQLLVPRRGTFFPWSDGPQNCVGKKFSLVEGVAVLARLFYRHRLRLDKRNDESELEARQRAWDCVNDVNYNLLLRMNHPERIKMMCIKIE